MERQLLALRVSLVARGSVDIRPLNENSEILEVSSWVRSCPLIFGLVRSDKVEESLDSVAKMGNADTSEMIKEKTSATRPARE